MEPPATYPPPDGQPAPYAHTGFQVPPNPLAAPTRPKQVLAAAILTFAVGLVAFLVVGSIGALLDVVSLIGNIILLSGHGDILSAGVLVGQIFSVAVVACEVTAIVLLATPP